MKYEIGSRIRKYRKENGLTQEELAARIHVSKGRVSNWEQGLNRPDADILAALCKALNISPSNLLNVHLADDNITEHEMALIKAYRTKPDLQHAVNILLGIEKS